MGAVLVILFIVGVSLYTMFPEAVNATLDRLEMRNRSVDYGPSDIYTSGRLYIWKSYIDFYTERSNVFQFLFGHGAVWNEPWWLFFMAMAVSAHNDALNLLIVCGVFGLGVVTYLYWAVLSQLVKPYRVACILLFIILFLTNGVIFHQSNILFVLFGGNKIGLRRA